MVAAMRLLGLRQRTETAVPERAPEGPFEETLDRLLPREELIDRFDASYLDDLPEILRELHGVDSDRPTDHELWPSLEELWKGAGRDPSDFSVAALPDAVRELPIDHARYEPRRADASVQKRHRYNRVRSWARSRGVRVAQAGENGREAVNVLQKEYSLQSGGAQAYEFEDLARPETGDPWTQFMIGLREQGVVGAEEPVLTIGPRWVSEIHYFRDRIGLRGTVGLDLFSNDEELVKVGDMHDMPFEDSSFALVYQRNTFDKSYDIRKALRECVRILRPGGVLISDDCYAYTAGVSDLSRTSIKHNRQVFRVLGENLDEVLHDQETQSREDWIERVGQLAVRIKK
jgi:SAM-dependent methyltransferase